MNNVGRERLAASLLGSEGKLRVVFRIRARARSSQFLGGACMHAVYCSIWTNGTKGTSYPQIACGTNGTGVYLK